LIFKENMVMGYVIAGAGKIPGGFSEIRAGVEFNG